MWFVLLTLVLLWPPVALSIVRHNAEKKKEFFIKTDTDNESNGRNTMESYCSSPTFCENQSGGRPVSEKGLMARLTDTLEDKDIP